MNIEVSSDAVASVWEALCAAQGPVVVEDVSRQTGVSLSRVNAILGRLHMAGLVDRHAEVPSLASVQEVPSRARRARPEPVAPTLLPGFSARRSLDSMAYATAVEIGIPLFLLERTVSLSKQARRHAFQLAETGQVDAARKNQAVQRQQQARATLRGRAASRAAATDLAKLVQDVSRVTPIAIPLDQEVRKLLPAAVKSSSVAIETPALARVREEVARQAAQALEALVQALERPR